MLVLADRVEVALAACRSLARHGHAVGAAVSARTSAVLASRAVDFRHDLPGPRAPQDVWDAATEAVIAERGYEVILGCNDIDVVRLVSTRLGVARVPSISGSQDVVRNKAALAQVCADVAVPYPRTWTREACVGDPGAPLDHGGRAVVKAATPAAMTGHGVVHLHGMTAVRDQQALLSAIEQYHVAGLEPIAQEYVDGPKLQAVLIRRAGTTTCRLVALVELETPAEATLRQLDSTAGIGADCIEALERVADRVGYEGVLQAEFVAAASGPPYLIDLNPRLWGGLRFAELIGLQMTERVVRDAVGMPPPPLPEESVGRRYHHVARELAHVAESPRRFRSVASTWSRHDVWDVPTIRDPGPFIAGRVWQPLRFRGRADEGVHRAAVG